MCNFKEPRFSLKINKFTTSRVACLWNKVLSLKDMLPTGGSDSEINLQLFYLQYLFE